MNLIKRVWRFIQRMNSLPPQMIRIQEALGRIEQRQIEQHGKGICDAEFRVFSQWGEDGIIQYLIKRVALDQKLFIEFGVENYTESNTRFLLVNNHWSGLVMDGSKENIDYIKRDTIYWTCNLKAEHAFITRENINELITQNGINGDVGLLSVDIDGNDYWVWEAITCIKPRIVICEYNGLFGPNAKVSTPYHPEFVRGSAHFSHVYYGASIAALCDLAGRKGYSLVASNAVGSNLFFVRNDLMGDLKAKTALEAYRKPQFRECRDEKGNLVFHDFETSRQAIAHLELFDFTSNSIKKIKDIPGII